MKPIQYLVLQAEQLSKVDKEAVATQLVSIKDNTDALIRTSKEFCEQNWAYEVKDHLGRIGILKFKGAEVALLIKRQVVTLEPLPQDPVPEGIITDPNNAWMRIDLLGVSPRNIAAKAGKAVVVSQTTIDVMRRELEAKAELSDQYELELSKMRKKVADLELKLKKKR